jgi:hypothetical protein
VQQVLGHRKLADGTTEYKVLWKGYSDPTWEPAGNMAGAEVALADYEAELRAMLPELSQLSSASPAASTTGLTESQSSSESSSVRSRSVIWKLFVRDGRLARCTVPITLDGMACGKLLQYVPGGATTALWRHLQRHHPHAFGQVRRFGDLDMTQAAEAAQLSPAPAHEALRAQRAFAEWICRSSRPFCVGEDPLLRHYVNLISKGTHRSPSADLIESLLPQMAAGMAKRLLSLSLFLLSRSNGECPGDYSSVRTWGPHYL